MRGEIETVFKKIGPMFLILACILFVLGVVLSSAMLFILSIVSTTVSVLILLALVTIF